MKKLPPASVCISPWAQCKSVRALHSSRPIFINMPRAHRKLSNWARCEHSNKRGEGVYKKRVLDGAPFIDRGADCLISELYAARINIAAAHCWSCQGCRPPSSQACQTLSETLPRGRGSASAAQSRHSCTRTKPKQTPK